MGHDRRTPQLPRGSDIDERIDEVIAELHRQICDAGVGRCELNFPRSRIAVWYRADACTCRLFTVAELLAEPVPARQGLAPLLEPELAADLLAQIAVLRFCADPLLACDLNLERGEVRLRFARRTLRLEHAALLAMPAALTATTRLGKR